MQNADAPNGSTVTDDPGSIEKSQRSISSENAGENNGVENSADLMYDKNGKGQEVDAFERDDTTRKLIGSEKYPLDLHGGRQNKHILGTNEYKQYVENLAKSGRYGPSRVTISNAEIEKLVSQYHGTGIFEYSDNGKWNKIERITVHPEDIGIAVNILTGKEAGTSVFTIHYSKYGYHIVPDYPSKKGAKGKK